MRAGAMLAALLVAVAIVSPGGSVRANGVPQLVKLTYLQGVSTWGPENAEGILEFSFAEAYARVDVKNLTPQDGYTYEGWMVAPTGSAYRVGEIAVSAAGIGTLETKLTGLEGYDYNLFVVVGRAAGDPADEMPARRSIAGRFTIISDERDPGAGGDVRPSRLPDTGEKAPDTTLRDLSLLAAGALAAGGIAIMLRRGVRGRSRQ